MQQDLCCPSVLTTSDRLFNNYCCLLLYGGEKQTKAKKWEFGDSNEKDDD